MPCALYHIQDPCKAFVQKEKYPSGLLLLFSRFSHIVSGIAISTTPAHEGLRVGIY